MRQRKNTTGPRPHTWLSLTGRLTISRPSGRDPETPTVRVEVVDEASRCIALELEMPMPLFAEALFGLAYQPCTLGINVSGVLGKQHEHRTVSVRTPRRLLYRGGKLTDEEARELDALVQPHEEGGWVAEMRDFENGHRYGERHADDTVDVAVSFHRFVDPPTPGETPG